MLSRNSTRLALALLAGTALAFAGGATAQENPGASAGLSLPDNPQFFVKNDPNHRNATVVVNGEVITGTDVDQRMALIIAASGGKISDEERQRLRLQVLRALMD